MSELAKRAVACKGWRWMPGMRDTNGDTRYMGGGAWAWADPYRHHAHGIAHDDWPDLDDPATRGCLLALVREARGDQTLAARFDDEYGWWVVDGNRWAECGRGDSEAEALVAALEAAGGGRVSAAAVAAEAAWRTYQEALTAALGADGAWDAAWVAAHAAWVAWDDAARAAGGEE